MKPASILITDDESNIRLTLRTALECEGYDVREASNGRDALEAIKAAPPDLMVLDLNMPILDGMAVLEQMKSLAENITPPRVIVLTAYGSIPAAVKATRLGAIDFLEKPITPRELREVIKSALDEPELDRPSAISEPPGGYEKVVDRVRRSLRLADLTTAEALLMRVADRPPRQTAEYFNLLGVLYEAQRKWRLARKCYGKAITASRDYEPAKSNMRRLLELQRFGHTSQAVAMGDEPDILWFAREQEFKA